MIIMPKTAKMFVAAIYACCPYCGVDLSDENGSQMFVANEITPGELIKCHVCGKESKMPSPFKK